MQSNRSVLTAAVGTVLMGARGPDDRVINSLPLAQRLSRVPWILSGDPG